MKLISRIKSYLEGRRQEAREREIIVRVKEESNLLNVFRIDGIDMITYDGIPVSRTTDKYILDRLAEYRLLITCKIRQSYERNQGRSHVS